MAQTEESLWFSKICFRYQQQKKWNELAWQTEREKNTFACGLVKFVKAELSPKIALAGTEIPECGGRGRL